MIGVFPPPIAQAIDAILGIARGAVAPAVAQEVFTRALRWNRHSRAVFDYWKSSADLKNGEVKSLVRRIEERFDTREHVLQDMAGLLAQEDVKGLLERVKDLKESSMALADLTMAMRKRNESANVFSPVATADDFIKTGINVYNGDFPAEALRRKIPAMVQLKKEYDIDAALFEKYFPEEKELVERLKQNIHYIEQSVGAAYTFLEDGRKEDLFTGLKALGLATSQMAKDLAATQEIRRQKGLSANPMVDEFLKDARARIEGTAGDEELQSSLGAIENYLRSIWGDTAGFFRDFLVRTPVREKYYPLFSEIIRELEESLKSLRESPPTRDSLPLLEKIGSRFAELLATREEFYREGSREKDLSKDVAIEELREVAKVVKDGVLHKGALEEKLVALMKRNSENIRKLDFLPDYDELKGVREILVRQHKAYEMMSVYFADGSSMRLLVALEEIEENFTHYLEAEGKLESWMKYVNWVVCSSCGHSNFPDERSCANCKAPMPAPGQYQDGYIDLRMTRDNEVYSAGDIGGVTSEGLRLKQTIDSFFGGEVTLEQLKEYLDYLRGKVHSIKGQFVQRLLPAIRKEPGNEPLQQLGEEFHTIMVEFESSLDEMFRYFQDSDPLHLKYGMQHMLGQDQSLLRLDNEVQQLLQNAQV